MSHTHTHIHTTGILAIKRTKKLPFVATWMDLENVILSKVSQTQATIIFYHLYMESKKGGTNELIKIEKESQCRKWSCGYLGGGRKGRNDKLGDWDWNIHTTIFKIDN